MEIKKATFVVSNSDYRKCPDTGLPEYAFIGRSNVGKSSLINMLTNNKSLAKTSLNRETLMNVYVLVDSRIPPQQIDIDFINFLGSNGIPLTIVYTKTDKQKQRDIAANVNQLKRILLESWEELPTMIMTSSVSHQGREPLLKHIDAINKQPKYTNPQDDNDA